MEDQELVFECDSDLVEQDKCPYLWGFRDSIYLCPGCPYGIEYDFSAWVLRPIT